MMRPRVTEENCMDMLWDYVNREWGGRIEEHYDECPYKMDWDDEELRGNQAARWFVYERRDASGRTVLDEFVDRFVDDGALAAKMLQMKNPVHDTFLMDGPIDSRNRVTVTAKSDGRRLTIELEGEARKMCGRGRTLTGRIHPWHEDGTHRLAGNAMIQISDEEMLAKYGTATPTMFDMIEERVRQEWQNSAESITIATRTRSVTLFRKFPVEWIDGICDSLGIDGGNTKEERIRWITDILTSPASLGRVLSGIPEDERTALEMVLKKGSSVKYAYLCSRAGGDDTGWSWDREPASAVGRLRRRGLLVVGRKRIGGRTYKVAVIPADMRAPVLDYMLKEGRLETPGRGSTAEGRDAGGP